jgi:hypothetical protein
MPTISLRLTDVEHAALKEWAHDSRRSLQKEAVYRLFNPVIATDVPEALLAAQFEKMEHSRPPKAPPPPVAVETASGGADVGASQVRPSPGAAVTPRVSPPEGYSRANPETHFKPDPKPVRKK